MNNLVVSLKRFFKNKNTVTILGVLAIVLILYIGYNRQIDTEIAPRKVPCAKVTIQPRQKIEPDMLDICTIPASILRSSNVISSSSLVEGKYANYNTVIPKGSLFYTNADAPVLVDKKDLPDSAFVEVPEGQVVYNFPVDMESTYGNSIFPNNNVDIYMKAENAAGQIMVGKLIENVKVLAVKDNNGQHVFENTQEKRTPSVIIFGVSPEINILLRKASYMGRYSVELFPVPHGSEGASAGELQVTSQNLKDFINANTVANDEILNPENTEPTEENIE